MYRIQRLRLLPALFLFLTVIGLGACATGGARSGAEAGQRSIALRVDNNLVPSVSLRIYAVADTGGRTMVGSVNPGSTTTLRFTPAGGTGQYRFVANVPLGSDIVSNPVSITAGDTVQWTMTSNLATVVDSL